MQSHNQCQMNCSKALKSSAPVSVRLPRLARLVFAQCCSQIKSMPTQCGNHPATSPTNGLPHSFKQFTLWLTVPLQAHNDAPMQRILIAPREPVHAKKFRRKPTIRAGSSTFRNIRGCTALGRNGDWCRHGSTGLTGSEAIKWNGPQPSFRQYLW